jgi:pimeloyl-[acyl-carrier protein] methyl ester esterase
MSKQQAFLWISGWSVSCDIWEPYYKEWPSANHYTLSFHTCEQVEHIMEQAVHTFQQIDAQQVIVVGWSMGAMVALKLALQFPERINRLFLISGVAEFVRKGRDGMGWDERVLRRMKKQLQINPAEVLHLFDQRMFSSSERQAGDFQRWSETFRKELPPLSALQAGLDFLQQFSLGDQVDSIQIPVFLLSGAEDEICPTEGTLALAKRLPRSTCTIWEESGHACFWTQRERFQQWMKEGLKDVYQ